MKNLMDIDVPDFERLTWHEAMDWYGSDKPDLRFGLKIVDLTEIARTCSFAVFRSVVDKGGIVRAIKVPGGADFTRSQIEELTAKAQSYGAKGMAWIAIRPGGEIYSILTKYFKENELQDIIKVMDAHDGDFILFCADKLATVRRTLGNLRLDVAEMLGIRDTGEYKFLFVTDFPQFEWSEDEKRWVATHHPFTMPYEEDVEYLFTDPGRVRAQAYDVVLNGIELGSGSVRIHRQDIQTKMFEALGFNDEQIEERFGFMVNAFRYGTPPHAGFAFGLDRLAMQLLDAESLREVIAFPKIKDASELMTGAPDFVDEEQLKVLGIAVGESAEKPAAAKAKAKKSSPTINVENVANLARLSFSDKEKESLAKEMNAIIDFANQLSELDTENVPITAHVVPISNIFRCDEVTNKPDRDELLSNAPTKADGYFTVPRVVES